jgi:hypothetical protein
VDADSEEVRKVSRLNRFLVVFLVAALMVAALVVAWGSTRHVEAQAGGTTADAAPLVLVGQKPRVQEFFAGDDANFTVSITNTGTVALQGVSVTNATTTGCNRSGLGPLAPGQSTSYTCTRENVNTSFLNVLEATGTADGGATDSHVANAFVKVLTPDLRITKRPTTQSVLPGATARFTVVIFNTSLDTVLIDVEVDDSAVNDCDREPVVPLNLGPGESIDYSCQQTNIQSPLTSVVTVTAIDPLSGDVLTASDVAWVDVLDVAATLVPQPNTVAEPGAPVVFPVGLINEGSMPLTLTGLTTNQFGNVLNSGNDAIDPAHNTCLPQPGLPTIQPYGGSYTCSFTAVVQGQPSDFSVILTATAKDRANQTVTATTSGTVRITNVPAAINVSATADPPFIHPPSSAVRYSVRVDNTGEADTVTVTQLLDSLLGSLDGRGTCDVPATIQPGFSYQCEFTATVAGTVGQQKSRTITAVALDDDLNPKTVTDSAIVTVSITDMPTQYAYMPAVTEYLIGSSCLDALPLSLNRQYRFLPPGYLAQQVFRFELTRSGRLTVEMANFVPRDGQLVVWTGVCGSLELIGRNPDTALNRTVELGTRPPGQYIIQIVNGNSQLMNVTDPYRLTVHFE